MKRFVKIISVVIVLLMTVTNIAALIFFGECIGDSYRRLQNPPPESSEGLGVIGDLLTPISNKIFIVILSLAIVVLVTELVLLIWALVKAIKSDTPERYRDFSILGLIEVVINIAIFWVVTTMVSNSTPEETLNSEISRWILVCLVTLICTIYDILISRKWMTDGACERIVTVSCIIFIFISGLGSMIFFVNGRTLGGVVCLCICVTAILITAVRIWREHRVYKGGEV